MVISYPTKGVRVITGVKSSPLAFYKLAKERSEIKPKATKKEIEESRKRINKLIKELHEDYA